MGSSFGRSTVRCTTSCTGALATSRQGRGLSAASWNVASRRSLPTPMASAIQPRSEVSPEITGTGCASGRGKRVAWRPSSALAIAASSNRSLTPGRATASRPLPARMSSHWRKSVTILRSAARDRVGATRSFISLPLSSIARLIVGGFPKQVFPAPEFALHAADAVEEGRKESDAVRLRGELEPGIVEQADQLVETLGCLLRILPQHGRSLLVGARALDRFRKRVRHGLEQCRVPLLGLLAGDQRDLRERAAKNLAAVGDDVRAGKL